MNAKQYTREQVSARVVRVVQDTLGVDPEKIVPTAAFVDDLGADSLDGVELIMCIEEEFGFDIDDEAAMRLETTGTVQSVIDYVYDNQ